MKSSLEPDQLASDEASCSGPTLFSVRMKSSLELDQLAYDEAN